MRATPPHINVPGDNDTMLTLPSGRKLGEHIMGRSGDLVGMTTREAVWRFGFGPNSESAGAFGVSLPEDFKGFLWVLATRKTGKIKDTCDGMWVELPSNFKRVIEGNDADS